MNKLTYNTINNEGVLKSLGPYRIIITDNIRGSNYVNIPPVKTDNVVRKEETTYLKKKVV